jgi:hypothetical protein
MAESTLPPLSLQDAARLVAESNSYEILAPYLTAAAVQADPHSANAILLKLAPVKKRDSRWQALLLPLLADESLRGTALYALGGSRAPEVLEAIAAHLPVSKTSSLALALGNAGDARALPYLLALLTTGAADASPWALFKALEPIVAPAAVAPLTAWLADNPSHPEAGNARTVLRKAAALASGKPLPPTKAPNFEPFIARLVAEGKKAAKAFVRAHPKATVCAFAFDASPYEEYFAACLDSAERPGASEETEIGRYQWHLFHEFELPVHSKLGKGAIPPSPSVQDGYVEHFFRPILRRACEELAQCGAFDGLRLQQPFRIGYAYPSESRIDCAIWKPR